MRTITTNSETDETNINDVVVLNDKETNLNYNTTIDTYVSDDVSRMQFNRVPQVTEPEQHYSSDFFINQNKQIEFNIAYENKVVSVSNFGGILNVVVNGVGFEVTEYGIETSSKVSIGAPIPPKKP